MKFFIQPNMLVLANHTGHWNGHHDDGSIIQTDVRAGTLGRVVSFNRHTMVTVKWQGKPKCFGPMEFVDLLTPPLACDIFA